MNFRPPVVLTIAGSDPSGGAGVQGDLKTFSALGAYGTAVLTSLTAQSTRGVTGVHTVPADFVRAQLDTLVDDIALDAAKIGMLASAATIRTILDFLEERADTVPVLVLDPVMVSTAGSRLLAEDAIGPMRRLIPHVSLITPNLPEAAVLLDTDPAEDLDTMRAQAATLQGMGASRVLVKGGHLGSDTHATDVWLDDEGEQLLTAPRIPTANSHGTGCALSSAIAALAPSTDSLLEATRQAKIWLTGTLQAADALRIGHGPGPVHHCHDIWRNQHHRKDIVR